MRLLRAPLARAVVFLLLAAAACPLGGIAVGTVGVSGPEATAWDGAVVSAPLVGSTVVWARLAAGFGFRAPDLLPNVPCLVAIPAVTAL